MTFFRSSGRCSGRSAPATAPTVVVSEERADPGRPARHGPGGRDDAVVSRSWTAGSVHCRSGDGRPYLAVFVLTHADQDHCRGFADLLEAGDDRGAVGDAAAVAGVRGRRRAVSCVRTRRHSRRNRPPGPGDEGPRPPAASTRVAVTASWSSATTPTRNKHAYAELPIGTWPTPGDSVTTLDGDGFRGPVRGVHPRAVQGRLRRGPQRDIAGDAGHADRARRPGRQGAAVR